MTPEQKGFYRMMLENRLSKLTGMAFQNFFSQIMMYAQPNFATVKPQGNEGDWKNDGYDSSTGRYYQVYAPEQLDESEAVKKLQSDFAGLVARWGNGRVFLNGVVEFYFVVNDRYRVTPGGYPTTIAALEKLKQAYHLKECKLFLAKDIEEVIFGLEEDKIINILGFPPNPRDIRTLNLSVIDQVIVYIIENSAPRSLEQSLIDPDFDAKIQFNQLYLTAPWLRDASYRSGSLEEYFDAKGNYIRQEIRNRLKGLYDESKEHATVSDKQLFHILEKITPGGDSQDGRRKKELQDAALVIMAYFFESCDIFEEPRQ